MNIVPRSFARSNLALPSDDDGSKSATSTFTPSARAMVFLTSSIARVTFELLYAEFFEIRATMVGGHTQDQTQIALGAKNYNARRVMW